MFPVKPCGQGLTILISLDDRGVRMYFGKGGPVEEVTDWAPKACTVGKAPWIPG